MQGQIKIGPEFFTKARRDYRDWRFALLREFCQNSFDCGSGRVDVAIVREGNDTRLTVANDGEPMTREVLTEKLLTLGGTGKNFEAGAVGGMGKAKELLYYSHLDYRISTGDLLVVGCGAQYELSELTDVRHGTESSMLLAGDEVEALSNALRAFCSMAQWSGTVMLNGMRLDTSLRKGTPRREFAWGKIYTNRQFDRLLIVRIGGMPMFSRRVDYKGCVVVELTGNSGERLSANRDSLLYQIGEELDELVLQLSVDKKSALRQKQAEIKRFEGERQRYEASRPKSAGNLMELLVSEVRDGMDRQELGKLAAFVRGGDREIGSGIATEVVSREEVAVSIGPEFILKNTTGMATPDYYTPGEQFSDYSRKLALAWAKCLLEIHRILEMPGDFSIGFCLDEDSGAEHWASREYGTVYFINPARLVCQRDKPQCRSFKTAFTGAWADRFAIISLAVHEIVHGRGFAQHDESFSSELTAVTAAVLPHLGRLTPLFRG